MIRSLSVLCLLPASALTATPPQSAEHLQEQLTVLQERIRDLEDEVDDLAPVVLVMLLFGSFCALWAQNTERNAWLWFFLGLFLGPFASIVLLAKNASDAETGAPDDAA